MTRLEQWKAKLKAAKAELPMLNDGEIYVGAIINADGTGEHIILLPGDNAGVNWKDAMAWAESIGGTLPNRVESALLFARMADQFEQDVYWSGEKYAPASGYAWFQDFDNGGQGGWYTLFKFRARAVRRVPIWEAKR